MAAPMRLPTERAKLLEAPNGGRAPGPETSNWRIAAITSIAAALAKGLRTAEGTALPENTRAELCRHLARLRVVREQIRAVEQERLRKLAAAPAAEKSSHAMVRLIARVY